MKKISSLSNPIIQYLRTLAKSKNRYQNQQFLVEGKYLVEEALKHRAVATIFLDESETGSYQFLLDQKVEIFLVTKAIIKKISQTVTPQPVVALCNFQKYQVKNKDNIIVLDNIQDPSNLGAILRSCCAFGVEKIFLSENSVDFYNHKVVSASKGAIFNIAFEYCDLITLMTKLKAEDYYFYGTFLHEAKQPTKLNQIKFHKKNGFLFGNEGQGISSELRILVDENFIIETTNKVESLNLATSVALTIYSLFIDVK
ncbi:TrmH family RNA methyltransferase [Spiroplasma platyhelix]|uniref:RNA methyltransferase n=1 Tax=Spiroplasma platyhelix PALS-1 TaxID=1276218 RepID=A0A846U144_9MOLU|nr:RNA methyltransferase [Spiroplasma platyhelix]MBE4704362.1 putative TrmH family tRNA/rRNA methyltransferase [Spiroplasma platyhelix PALS-1]NKE38734.1 RNA methyltransferase [Spiroplasma platyhelix PALS-1]UJB28945.1 RNA methyltransferase, TrmH family [Spiroplasma platyhelix PALS-1]